MSSNQPIFQVYTAAVEALTSYFSGRPEAVVGEESPSEYSFTDAVQFTKDWQPSLVALLEKLRAASFRCTLTLSTGLYQWQIQVFNAAGGLALTPLRPTEPEGATPLPDEAVPAQDTFHAAVEKAVSLETNLAIDELFNFINAMIEKASVKLTLSASLSKDQIQPGMESEAKVVYYLFAENLVRDLQHMTLENFEIDFCEAKKRTLIVLFDTELSLTGEYIAIVGKDQEGEFAEYIKSRLTSESLKRNEKTLEFRKSESLGDFRTEWLIPEFLTLNWDLKPANGTLTNLNRQLQTIQALLSTLFLADFVDRSTEVIGVEYRGIGVAKFPMDRGELLKAECSLDAVYQLYVYAYEGFSADKLEIVQQFLSLMVNNALTLCSKSLDIREAARKTYAVVLRDKVSVYFDALNKIQERIKTATDKSAESAIELTRDVSGDIYKIAGVLAVAVAGALLKPDLGWPVGLAASLVIGAYLTLVIFYHLETLTRAYDLGFQQHTDYVNSFEPLLGEAKIKEFLRDGNFLDRAKHLFLNRVSAAEQLYAILLVFSMLMTQTSIHKLLTK